MRVVSSLTNRIFLACTVVAALSLAFAFSFVNVRASREAEDELRRGLNEASRLVDEHRANLSDTFTRLARLIADLPKLKAAVETGDPPTIQPLADEYARQMRADVFVHHAGGVKKDAAELMGISQRALSYYFAKYRID